MKVWFAAMIVCGVVLALSGRAQDVALAAGEKLGPEWFAKSGLDPTFENGKNPIYADARSGAASMVVEWPAGSGKHAVKLSETTGGGKPNAGSVLKLQVRGNSGVVKRINEILALPLGSPAVPFVLSLRAKRLKRGSRCIALDIRGEYHGRERPHRFFMTGETGIRSAAAYNVDQGFALYSNHNFPALRFLVKPTGGKKKIHGFDIRIHIRVDHHSTPEELLMDDLRLHEIIPAPKLQKPRGTMQFVGNAPSVPMLNAARKLGWEVLPTTWDPQPGSRVYVINRRIDSETLAKRTVQVLDEGASVLVSLGRFERVPATLSKRLPVNPWPNKNRRLKRYSTAIVATPGSAFAKLMKPQDLVVAYRADMHLPYAPIEHGEHRYNWVNYHKDLLNTDWQIHLQTAVDGQLPMLVSGRSGKGKVLCFAAHLFHPFLLRSKDYPAFAAALLKLAEPPATPAMPGGDLKFSLQVARHQPDGLKVGVRNNGAAAAGVVLTYKLSNWSRELMNAATKKVTVPAGQTLMVDLDERSVQTGDPALLTSGDRNVPFRRLHIGIALPDRSKLLAEKRCVVATEKQVALTIEEDASTYASMKGWVHGRLTEDGVLGRRYVYRPGDQPVIHVKVRNGLMNIAPLAQAADLQWKENPSVNGLNDLSYSRESIRGRLPLQGGWGGKPAAQQKLQLTWDAPVTPALHRLAGYGAYRHWLRSNPKQFSVTVGETKLAEEKEAAFTTRHGTVHAYHDSAFAATRPTKQLQMLITGLNDKANYEPRHVTPSNCSILEWEVYGWPHAEPPGAVTGKLKVVANDLLEKTAKVVLEKQLTIAGLEQQLETITLPTRQSFGPVRYDISFVVDGTTVASKVFDALFVPAEGTKLINKKLTRDWQKGQLCSPGWVHVEGFGTGTHNMTRGWGGPDDKIWALVHNQMEQGSGGDASTRMFTTANRFCHYTNPWRDLPNGRYNWDWVIERIIDKMLNGKWKRKGKRLHIVGSDRWNGIPVHRSWGWGEFIGFDEYLKKKNGKGLQGRTRKQIANEIKANYGEDWQKWHMHKYADKIIESVKKFEENGLQLTFETHGSFPFAGGELGRKLAQTHIGVGTDLFWELRNQDLYWSLGTRFGIVAVNPDLRSGAYNQWGWINSDLNRYWFANSGSVEPARRQWYSTYYVGRVNLAGQFKPYHVYGFSSQGGHSTQFTKDDIQKYTRTVNLMTQVRPERPTGVGIVVSWAIQERRMGKKLGKQGFGLYTESGWEQVDSTMGHAYHKLVKQGVPISFVTSTHALKQWHGNTPLIVVDGFNLEPWEFDDLERLHNKGTPIFAIGRPDDTDHKRAYAFYGVREAAGRLFAADATTTTINANGKPLLFIRRPLGKPPILYCPLPPSRIPGYEVRRLADLYLEALGKPLQVPQGLVPTTFISNNRLFLALGDQGDRSRQVTIRIKPELLKSDLKGKAIRVIDLDRSTEVEAKKDGDDVVFTIPVLASDGRMVMFEEGGVR